MKRDLYLITSFVSDYSLVPDPSSMVVGKKGGRRVWANGLGLPFNVAKAGMLPWVIIALYGTYDKSAVCMCG